VTWRASGRTASSSTTVVEVGDLVVVDGEASVESSELFEQAAATTSRASPRAQRSDVTERSSPPHVIERLALDQPV